MDPTYFLAANKTTSVFKEKGIPGRCDLDIVIPVPLSCANKTHSDVLNLRIFESIVPLNSVLDMSVVIKAHRVWASEPGGGLWW